MNGLSLASALALAGAAATAQASVTSFGGSFGQSCYLAAQLRDTSLQAMNDCNRALTVETLSIEDRVATHVNRGILYLHRSASKEAAADFDRALALDPNQPEAWLNKAILTVKIGEEAEALPMIQRALDLKTRRPAMAYYIRAIIEERRGNVRAAYDDFRRAQELEPNWHDPAVELRRFKVRQARPGLGAA